MHAGNAVRVQVRPDLSFDLGFGEFGAVFGAAADVDMVAPSCVFFSFIFSFSSSGLFLRMLRSGVNLYANDSSVQGTNDDAQVSKLWVGIGCVGIRQHACTGPRVCGPWGFMTG